MSGYVRPAVKSGGFWIQPWIFWPSKLVYQNSSGSVIVSCAVSASLNPVSFFESPVDAVTTSRSPITVAVERTTARCAAWLSAV